MTRRIRWVPHEHGAWAIIALPLLLGVAAAGARPAHALLAVAAVSAYLFSAPAVEWLRTRRPEHLPPTVLFGAVLAVSGIALVVAWPELAIVVVGVVAAGLVAVAFTINGRPRSVVVSLIEVAQAIALVPAAAIIAGTLPEPSTARAALASALYLVGSVLLVRSMIRARGDARFLTASVGFHAAGVLLAVAYLPWPYAAFAVGLLARAVALPIAQARFAAGPRRLRPIHIGIVEIVASVTLAALAFTVGF